MLNATLHIRQLQRAYPTSVTVAPQLVQRFALLLRGEAYRWGCDTAGVALQMRAAESQLANIVKPLESRGHTVRIFLAHDHRLCKAGYLFRVGQNSSRIVYRPDTSDAIAAITALFEARRVALVGKLGNVKDQPDSITAALDLFLNQRVQKASAASGFVQSVHAAVSTSGLSAQVARHATRSGDAASSFDFLIVSRYDVRLLTPIISWPCYNQPQQVSAASRCEPGAWERFHCIADHFWIVPRLFLSSYAALVGSRLNVSHYTKCCFGKRCLQKAGHGCFNVFEHYWGSEALGFCWPQPVRSVAEPNPNYQCCMHGRARVDLLNSEHEQMLNTSGSAPVAMAEDVQQ